MPAAPARRDESPRLGAKKPLALVLLYVLAGPTNTCGYYDASHSLSCVLAGPTSTWAPVCSAVVIGHLVGILTGSTTWDPFPPSLIGDADVPRPVAHRDIAETKIGKRL